MADSWNWPALINKIAQDVPFLQRALNALLKQDPTSIKDAPSGAKRLYEVSSSKWQWQEYNGSSWTAVPFLQHNVDQLDGYHAAITPAASTIAVRNASGLLQDSITGNAATASSAATLSQTLPVAKGGTGATTSEAARSNLGVPPTSHISTDTTYGVGNATQYGHLKLSDATDSASGVSGGVAATPAAAKAAKDAADAAQSSADAAMTKASTLATSSTPGIVKPGTGLQIGGEGVLNVVAEQTGCLPLTGGTITGILKFNLSGTEDYIGNISAVNDENGKRVLIDTYEEGDCGAFLHLRKGTDIINPGGFEIGTRNADNSVVKLLSAGVDGTFLWDGSEVFLPAGTVFAFAGNINVPGCLICNGASVSRTTYSRLFAAIGTTYGTGDGSTTFNLPNLTDRFIQGSDTVGTVKWAGLPNIEGHIGSPMGIGLDLTWIFGDSESISGAFIRNMAGRIKTPDTYHMGDGLLSTTHVSFNASRSNSIYGNSTTVQPPALTMRYYIKY